MIKSPFITKLDRKDIIFENKIKQLFQEENVDGAFIFYIPKKGDVHTLEFGLCPHQILTLGENLVESSEQRLEKGECED